MKEALELLDKLIELGKVYGLPGLLIAAFTIFSGWAFKISAENVVEDRKNQRSHQRLHDKMLNDRERHRKKLKRKE